MSKKPTWDVNGPDDFVTGQVDIRVADDGRGHHQTFGAAKKDLIEQINAQIWRLKQYKKEVQKYRSKDFK